MNFILDENCQDRKLKEPDKKNTHEILTENGFKPGITDIELLELATRAGRTIITRDRGFILLAIRKGVPIVWLHGKKLYLVTGKRIK